MLIVMKRFPKHCKYADNTYDNIAFVSTNQDYLVCYYSDIIRTGKIDIFDLFTGERLFSRDSRGVHPSDNYALEDVSGLMYDFDLDCLYTGNYIHSMLSIGTRAGLLHIWNY